MKKIFITTLLLISIAAVGYKVVSAQGDATLELKTPVTQARSGDEIIVDIVLKNPDAANVISVRSWLEYNPAHLLAENIDTSESSFPLSAPGEDTISSAEGLIKIGRSNISGGVTDVETTVAKIRFKVLASSAANTDISFYDFQVSELGHTSVNIIESGFPVNILAEKPETLRMSLNHGVSPPVQPVVPTPIYTDEITTDIGGVGAVNFALARPTGLMANTGHGYVNLKWSAVSDPARIGFNIYYGKVSGQYTRRRSVGDYENYRIDGLTDNEAYYFAVASYDIYNRESDYSNEVGIIVNQPLSSTNPFTSYINHALAAIPSQPQNGPLAGWLIFSAAGLSGAIVYGKRKYRRTESAVS